MTEPAQVTELYNGRQWHVWKDGIVAVRAFCVYMPASDALENLPLPKEGDSHLEDERLTCRAVIPWPIRPHYLTVFAIYATFGCLYHVKIEDGKAVVMSDEPKGGDLITRRFL